MLNQAFNVRVVFAFRHKQVTKLTHATAQMVDQDADGFISESDLTKMLQQLGELLDNSAGKAHYVVAANSAIRMLSVGQTPTPSVISSYFVGITPRQLSFTTFLTMVSMLS